MEKINESYNETLKEQRTIYKEANFRYIRKDREGKITKELKYAGKGKGPVVKIFPNDTFEVKVPEKITSYKELESMIKNLEELRLSMRIIGLKDESFPEIKKALDLKELDIKKINELVESKGLNPMDAIYMRTELNEFRKGMRNKPEWMFWN